MTKQTELEDTEFYNKGVGDASVEWELVYPFERVGIVRKHTYKKFPLAGQRDFVMFVVDGRIKFTAVAYSQFSSECTVLFYYTITDTILKLFPEVQYVLSRWQQHPTGPRRLTENRLTLPVVL